MPTLVYLYGPPAAGKLTIAEALVAHTGFRLFHNHLTVNAVRSVFDFGSPAFVEVIPRVRLDVFETAMRHGVSLVFTNNSARPGFTGFTDEVQRVIDAAGGTTCFVHVTAPDEVLLARVGADVRRHHGKLLDPDRLREMLATNDLSPRHPDDLRIDSATVAPSEAAQRIAARLGLS